MRQYHVNDIRDTSKLILVANRKEYMRFRLAPRSMTLDDLELLFLTFGEFRGIWQILARWSWRLLQSTIISRHFSCFG